MAHAIRLFSGLILLLLNAFFVASEFALTRLRQYSRRKSDEYAGLARAWRMTKQLEIYLTSCQIGITTTSILLGVVAEPAVTELISRLFTVESIGGISSHAVSITISVILINFIHTIWGEQAPTYLGVEKARKVARYTASPLYWWTYAIYPFLIMGDRITKATLRLFNIEMKRSWLSAEDKAEVQDNDEAECESGSGSKTPQDFRADMADLLRSGNLEDERQREVLNALEIGQIPVSQIKVPRDEIVYLSTEKPFSENLQRLREHMHTRYPLAGTSIDDLKGTLYTPQIAGRMVELQNDSISLSDLAWPPLSVSGDMPVSLLIDRFQEKKQELALVRDNGQTTGLVTLTDALEAIIGSAEDPLDQ